MIIYKLTSPDNKHYIGQTKRGIETRFREHVAAWKRKVLRKEPLNSKLYHAFNKHDPSNWIIEILEECNDLDQLNIREEYYVNYFNTVVNGYNITRGGDGRKVDALTEEHKNNISIKHKRFYQTDEGKKVLEERSNFQKGNKHGLNKRKIYKISFVDREPIYVLGMNAVKDIPKETFRSLMGKIKGINSKNFEDIYGIISIEFAEKEIDNNFVYEYIVLPKKIENYNRLQHRIQTKEQIQKRIETNRKNGFKQTNNQKQKAKEANIKKYKIIFLDGKELIVEGLYGYSKMTKNQFQNIVFYHRGGPCEYAKKFGILRIEKLF